MRQFSRSYKLASELNDCAFSAELAQNVQNIMPLRKLRCEYTEVFAENVFLKAKAGLMMDMYNSLFSASCVLNEQVARQIFDILPERGPVVVIIDRDGHFWPSDSERFSELKGSEQFLKELCVKIDDGAEPVMTQVDDYSIVGTQLATEHTNCGYVIIALPRYSPESTLINIDLIEMLLSQIGLIAKLIEKNSLLYELQVKQFSGYSESEIASN